MAIRLANDVIIKEDSIRLDEHSKGIRLAKIH